MKEEDAFSRLDRARLAGGHIPEVRWILDNVARWVRDGVEDSQARPLQSYLGLPATAARCKRHLRDEWLVKAATEIEAPGAWSGCCQLATEWLIFVARGGWDGRSDNNGPPADITSRLRLALWWATRYNGGEALKAVTLFENARITSVFCPRKQGPSA